MSVSMRISFCALGVSACAGRIPIEAMAPPHMSTPLRVIILSSSLSRMVSGLLVDGVRFAEDVGFVDMLGPILRVHVLDADRNGVLAVIERACHRFGDGIGNGLLLSLGSAGVEFDDDVRHDFGSSNAGAFR